MASGTGIGEFFVSLSVDAVSGQLTVSNLIQSFGELEIATVAEIGALWSLGIAMARTVDQSIQMSLGFKQFTMHTGLSAQELQKWQRVAEQSHASVNDVVTAAETLTKKMADLEIGGTGGGALGAFQQLHIAPLDTFTGKAKPVFEVLRAIGDALQSVHSVGQQQRLLDAFGIPSNMLETLLATHKEFDKKAAIAPGMNKEQEEQLDQLRQTFVQIEILTKQIGVNLAAGIAPTIEKWLHWMQDVVGEIAEMYRMVFGLRAMEPIKQLASAYWNTWGDMLNAVAGHGLDLNDIEKQQGKVFNAGRLIWNDWFSPSAAAQARAERGGATSTTTINKQDTYHIHEANDPHRTGKIVADHLNRVIDGFDRQQNNGGR